MNPGLTQAFVAVAGALFVVLALPVSTSRRRRRGGQVVVTRSAPDPVSAYENVARDLRSGLSLRAALVGALGQHPQVTPGLLAELRADRPLAQAIDTLPLQHGMDALFVHALRVCVRTGADAADVIDRAVVMARERLAWRAERRAQAAQARLSAWLLTLLPLVFAAWSLITSARVRDAALHSPVVGVCLLMGCALNVTGWCWMRRLVNGSVQ